ncbi:hypothetical protein [Wolbachia endosymbiont (group E) of Neria commutata]|uniref:hypothetical protein n=1 Tax=Wolbachia endosymbiont (group E) of Neria commutata TaxID=3066149 RepID=UPI003132E497
MAQTKLKTHVFIFTEDVEAQHSDSPITRTRNFEFTKGEWKNVMGKDYTELDARKLQIDVITILKDKYELVKRRPESITNPESKKLYLYLKRDGVLEYVAKDVHGRIRTIQISRGEVKGNYAFQSTFFNEIKEFLGRSGKDLSGNVRNELLRITSAKGYTLKSGEEDEKINIEVENNKKIKNEPATSPEKFSFEKVTKKLDKSVYLEDYIEKLANPDTEIDQVQDNLKEILTYIKKIHTDLKLKDNVYGIEAREADQHGFTAGIFDHFRYRDNTKIYLEQFSGRGYADVILLVRGPDRAVDSVPILIELKTGTEGKKITPSYALEEAKDYVKGFRSNKMRILTNANNVVVVGLNLDFKESFEVKVEPIKQPSSPLMEEFIKLANRWNNQQVSEEDFKQKIVDLLSSEYYTFPGNKETRDIFYFSRYILGQSILVNELDRTDVKKYVFSYNEYPLESKTKGRAQSKEKPVTTLVFIKGNKEQDKIAFVFHIIEQETQIKNLNSKKIPVIDIPEVGKIENVIEIQMSLKKYKTGLSFKDLFQIEQVSQYRTSDTNQQFTGDFSEIPNSDELKKKFNQTITSQYINSSDSDSLKQAYRELFAAIADAIYPIRGLITNEARLQAILNGLFSSYSDLKLQETSSSPSNSAKVVIIPEFQVGAGGRVDMVIQGIGPSLQGTKEYTPIALEFKLINKNLNQDQLKQEVNKLTEEQNTRYAKGAALKAITDSDKMFFMGVVVNVGAKDKNSLISTSDELISAKVSHSSIHVVKDVKVEKVQQQELYHK